MSRVVTRAALLLAMFTAACGGSSSGATVTEPNSDPDSGVEAGPAPKYSELFDAYFAPGTPGHGATVGCHADPGHTVWRCGPTKADCYAGMVDVGLIDNATPADSWLIDPQRSPLVWFNGAGNMPFDAQNDGNDQGRDAIVAWVMAGALDD
jgi:hypothetical protein